MSILDAFRDWQSVDGVVKRITKTLNTGTGLWTESTSTIGTYKCIFWVGKQAESVVSEKIRSKVDAVAVFDIGRDIKPRDTITVNSVDYNVIETDNVAFQDEALVVPLAGIK